MCECTTILLPCNSPDFSGILTLTPIVSLSNNYWAEREGGRQGVGNSDSQVP